jgi:hypothetical protein
MALGKTNMDHVLEEVREVREEYARQFGYDLRAIHQDLKEQEQASALSRLNVQVAKTAVRENVAETSRVDPKV